MCLLYPVAFVDDSAHANFLTTEPIQVQRGMSSEDFLNVIRGTRQLASPRKRTPGVLRLAKPNQVVEEPTHMMASSLRGATI
jgi:hypothetical protein